MNCNDIHSKLADYLGNELTQTDRIAVDRHLANCGACAGEVTSLQETLSALGKLDTVSHDAAAARTNDLRVVKRRPIIQRLALASLRIAAVLALGFALGRTSVEPLSNTNPNMPTPNGTERAVAQANTTNIHPDWLVIAERLNRNSSGLAGAFRHLAKGYER
ncbi:MAG: zf-HC2 domain-containing protein [Phycisphaerales bacterium]|nr:zf-HC2 domain-containing protein [Phycisphaerales bacterium]